MLVLILGTYGSGKTLLSTILAELAYKDGRTIVSNYTLKPPIKYTPFTPDILFDSELFGVDMFLDELYSLVDSRHSSSKYARLMSYILFQSRKRGVNIIGTTQLNRTIDVRFREMYDVVIVSELRRNGFKYTFHNRRSNFKMFLSWEKATSYFDLYDTNEIIVSDQMENLQYEFVDNDRLEDKAEDCIEDLLQCMEEFKVSKLTNDFLVFFCRKFKKPMHKDFKNALKFVYKKRSLMEASGVT